MVGLIELGLDLYVMAFMALYGIHVLDVPGLLIFVVDKHGLAVLFLDPSGQAHGLAFFGGLGFFLLSLVYLLVAWVAVGSCASMLKEAAMTNANSNVIKRFIRFSSRRFCLLFLEMLPLREGGLA